MCISTPFNFLIIILICISVRSEVSIDSEGGYENVIVGIAPSIQEDKVESVLLELEDLFREATNVLSTATRGNTFFKEIIFLLPQKYKSSLPGRSWLPSGKNHKNPDIIVTENDLFYNPYTIQHAGCGEPGLRIHIPKEFLDSSKSDKAKALVREWAHYRYGVFDESGFPSDEVYPACYRIPGSDTIKVSDCTDKKAIYEFRKNSTEEYERFPSSCNPVPVSGQNNHIASSLMSKMNFPEVHRFCDDESHNRNNPSKHNALCREQSAWKIISMHDDFKFKRRSRDKRINPTFRYVIESDPYLVLLVDSSQDMAMNDRLDLVKNACSYFLLNDLPENSTVKHINLKRPERDLTIKIEEQTYAKRIIDVLPDTYGEICLYCGLQRALRGLGEDSGIPYAEVVVITATDISEKWLQNITSTMKTIDVKLHAFFFKRKLKEPPLLAKLVESSGGRFFHIAEDFSNGIVSSTTLLYEAFRSIYQSFSWTNRNHVLVDQKVFSSCAPRCFMSFNSDRSMQSFQVLLTGPEFTRLPVASDTLILSNDDQSFAPGHTAFAFKREIPAYVFTIENPQSGSWNLSFEIRPEFTKPVIAMVRAKSKQYEDIVNMHSWITVNENYLKIRHAKRPPIKIYSELKKGNYPVVDANVTAFIHRAGSGQDVTLKLKDGGEGDPDITGYDGIFSRYLTDITESGYYTVTVIAEMENSEIYNFSFPTQRVILGLKQSQCCGSLIPKSFAYDTGIFKRIVTFESFFIKKEKIDGNFSPRRITDLRVDKVDVLENNVKYYVLKWTAPGDNYDKGTASDYELKVFRNRDDALNDFEKSDALTVTEWNIHGPWLIPSSAGTVQTAIVELKNLTDGIYFMAMRTTNHIGKIGEVSNVIEIKYDMPNILPITSIDPTGSITLFPESSTDDSVSDKQVAQGSSLEMAIGLTCGILFILILVALILFIYFTLLRNSKDSPKSKLNQGTKKTESNDTLCRSTGAGNISIISPVNSWGADSLLSHYEAVNKKKSLDSNMDKIPGPSQEDVDNVSVTSSKYSYVNKLDQNSSLYDPVYFHQVRDRDDINYPFNPIYIPFNPIYTSSLRRLQESERVCQYPIDNHSFHNLTIDSRRPDNPYFHSLTMDGRRTHRLNTDV